MNTKIEFWRFCWNCGHESLFERISWDMFARVVSGFSSDISSKVNKKFWTAFIGSYSYCKCKKCNAPSLFIDEYLPKKTDDESHFLDMKATLEEKGELKSDELIHSLKYPGFSVDPFPEWTLSLEEDFKVIFWEVYQAISLDLNSLAMMGIRAIIDKFATKQIGDIGGFEKKLSVLNEKNIINEQQYRLLNIVIDAGNASAHRGFTPTTEQLKTCLKIVENLLVVEQFGPEALSLKNEIPPRKI